MEPIVESWLQKIECSPLNGRAAQGRSKVALVGASRPKGGEKPPLEDPSWDVWGCNSLWNLHGNAKGELRADAWFELHPISAQTPQEWQDMQDCPVPLYVLDPDPLLPRALVYPLEEIRATFGSRDYFTVTFAYQIALAMWIGYEEIGLFGVELYQGSVRERRVELPCLNYWLGLAIGKGVKITLPEYSKLLYHQHLYGYDYDEDVQQSKIDDRDIAMLWIQEQQKETDKLIREKVRR